MTSIQSKPLDEVLQQVTERRRWDDLVVRAGASFFQTSAWTRSWWEVLAGEPPGTVTAAVAEGTWQAMCALCMGQEALHRRLPLPLRHVTMAGSGPGASDHNQVLLALDADPVLRTQVWNDAVQRWKGRAIAVRNAPFDHPAAASTDFRAVDRHLVPQLRISASYDEIESSWTKNRRRSLRKKTRRFAEAGGEFRWLDKPGEVMDALHVVFDLHERRREALAAPSRFAHDEANREFHRRLVDYASDPSSVWVQLAELRGEPVGALYGFRAGGVYSVFQSGWDPTAAEFSVGLIQYAHALREAIQREASLFDMCRGDDRYKRRFSGQLVEEQTLVRPCGVSGRLLALKLSHRQKPTSAELVEDADDV